MNYYQQHQSQFVEGLSVDRRQGQSSGLAEWLNAPGKPTILFYGHYHVQPAEPLDESKSPPFEPQIRGNDIFARGSSDDKGQTYIQMKAVEGLPKSTGISRRT